jgi:prepilin-type processing-associated H-X9-DG protein
MTSLRAAPYRINQIWSNLRYPPPFPKYTTMQNACPERKTPKQLGSLSVVADRFGKQGLSDANGRMSYPGDGLFAHKEGYNVLYGDGSVRWLGDPQQKHIWNGVPDANYSPVVYGSNIVACDSWQTLSYGIGFFNHFDQDGEVLQNRGQW